MLLFSNDFHLLQCLQIRNEKAKRYLNNMRKKSPIPFSQKFPNADPLAVRLLERLLAFDPKNRPSAEEIRFSWTGYSFASYVIFIYMWDLFNMNWYNYVSWYWQLFCLQALADPYFHGLANADYEPCTQPISKFLFEFERRRMTKEDVRELIYREVWPQWVILFFLVIMLYFLSSFFLSFTCNVFVLIFILFESKQILEYHPQMLQEYLQGTDLTSFMYPRFDIQTYFALNSVQVNLGSANLSWIST